MTLVERRAIFIYDAARLAAIAANAPVIPIPYEGREQAFKDQFLEVIERECGPNRSSTPEIAHERWVDAYFKMGWCLGPIYDREKKVHPDLVGYWELGQLERDKDAVFLALCDIARQWIY